VEVCAEHGANLGGENPLPAVGIGRASLGKGVSREGNPKEADDKTKVVTNRNQI